MTSIIPMSECMVLVVDLVNVGDGSESLFISVPTSVRWGTNDFSAPFTPISTMSLCYGVFNTFIV